MSVQTAVGGASEFPLRFEVDYPESLSRLLIFVKWLLAIPVCLVLLLAGAGYMPLAALLTILFRRKYPRWWFDFQVAYLRFNYRLTAYFLLLRDEYPALEDEQAVHLDVDYPAELNRWLPLVKWILAIPHFVVLLVLGVLVYVVLFIAWFAILFTGQFPKGLFDFVVGVQRWSLRVAAYAVYLFTDQYPPFSLK